MIRRGVGGGVCGCLFMSALTVAFGFVLFDRGWFYVPQDPPPITLARAGIRRAGENFLDVVYHPLPVFHALI